MATEIKVRAEQRCGELLATTEKNKGSRVAGVQRSNDTTTATLADMGLTRDESSRYQQLAAMPAEPYGHPHQFVGGTRPSACAMNPEAWRRARMQDVIDKALLLVDRVNHALRFAEAVDNPQMRAVRARVAVRFLEELQELTDRHPFLKIERLDSVEAKLAELLAGGGPNPPIAHSGDPLGSAGANTDLIKGLEFRATLQLRTPLSVLRKHGKVHKNLAKEPPAYAKEPWHGHWSLVLKTWKELGGADIPDWTPSTVATDLGPMEGHGQQYYEFLMAVRRVAADRSIPKSDRRSAVEAEAAKPQWSRFTERHGGAEAVARKILSS